MIYCDSSVKQMLHKEIRTLYISFPKLLDKEQKKTANIHAFMGKHERERKSENQKFAIKNAY